MKAKEIRQDTPTSLGQRLVALRKEWFELRMKHANRALRETHRLKAVRRDIARVATVLRETLAAGDKA